MFNGSMIAAKTVDQGKKSEGPTYSEAFEI